ncbi:hypothetical protein RND59_07440 [Vibrio ruber]|uniref:hypothetical protein n=1 Tax=Vibrio ruber TaxID=184755 RepID=UPI0028935507|nr:hypothetical protein [Vibrio ruber]WNJ96888.1 hypothetical protein RND59_07440 [Vibrio ruber]
MASVQLGNGFAILGGWRSAMQFWDAARYDEQQFGYIRSSTYAFHIWKGVGDALAYGVGFVPYVGVAVNTGWTAFNVSGEVNKVQEGMRWLDNEQ